MSAQVVVGHERVFERFRATVARGRLASTFLFVGPPGIGKKLVALRIAQALLCETNAGRQLDACGYCPDCQMVQAGTHPDLFLVSKPPDRAEIPVDLFIGDREHRMQVGLCHDISLKPFRGGRRIAIIDDADHLNEEGANCLLKTLEEPPPRSVLILIGTSEQKQLPTIRSRCQVVRFEPLPNESVARLLVERGIVESPDQAQALAELADGSVQRAAELADDELREFRLKLLGHLALGAFFSVDFAKDTLKFVESAGKESSARRGRLRQLIFFAAQFYRELMCALTGLAPSGDPPLREAAHKAATRWRWGEEGAAAALDRCLLAEAQTDGNANLATLIECWLDDLGTRR